MDFLETSWKEFLEFFKEEYVKNVLREDEIYVRECPFGTILVTGSSNIDVLGRYIVEDVEDDDCLLHYRKYIKDTTDICMWYQYQEITVFYRTNSFFDVESVSDNEVLKKRVSLPF